MNLTTAAAVTKALGHTGRLRILTLLRAGPLSVCQMATVLETAVSTISGHLLRLRHAGLVREQRRGKWVYYRLTQDESFTSVIVPLLSAIGDNSEVRRDIDRARALRGRPPLVACDGKGIPDDMLDRSGVAPAGRTPPGTSRC